MQLLTDPVEVFRLLETHGEDAFDVKRAHFSLFRCDHETAALVFCPEGKFKGPRLYLFPSSQLPGMIEEELYAQLDAIDGDGYFAETRTYVLHQLRMHIESQPATHFLFDAH